MVFTKEVSPGIIQITISTVVYGQAGQHWKNTLSGPKNGGYGRIYIQRFGAKQRRYWHTRNNYSYYKGEKGANQDECPGAMFIWSSSKEPSVEAIDAIDNQKLGRELGIALRQYKQKTEKDLWEVKFTFV